MAGFSEQVEGVVAIDGTVLRRSSDRARGKSPLHMVSAWGCEQRMVLAQIATDAKSNEITAVPKLLDMLSLKGTIVTTDAQSRPHLGSRGHDHNRNRLLSAQLSPVRRTPQRGRALAPGASRTACTGGWTSS